MAKSQHSEEWNLDLMETELRLGLPGAAAAKEQFAQKNGKKRSLSDEATAQQAVQKTIAVNSDSTPPPKAQIVGWPPVRSFRKTNVSATNVLVKVSMDGAPYLRKTDLRMYSSYHELSRGLEKMFGCFTMGRCGSGGGNSSNVVLMNGSEYVGTYEDKEGDWMMVGDGPWEMFVDSCKRIRIVKASEANIGLAPRKSVEWA